MARKKATVKAKVEKVAPPRLVEKMSTKYRPSLEQITAKINEIVEKINK